MAKRKTLRLYPTCVYVRSPSLALYLDIEDGTASATVEVIRNAIFASEEFLVNLNLASQVFTLWMISPLLELQLKLSHKPFHVRQCWRSLLQRYCNITPDSLSYYRDEPILMLQRNLFFSRKLEEKIQDDTILELLYEEARYNIIEGRYPCTSDQFIALGALQAHIELGPCNPFTHTMKFFRERQSRFLPFHVCHEDYWKWLPISSKRSVEVRLAERFLKLPNTLTKKMAIRKYLEFCWSLPFYGSAFFKGQLEASKRSWLFNNDIPILIAINGNGIFLIDDQKCELLLGLKYNELNWDYAEPSISSKQYNTQDSLPCLFIQFQAIEETSNSSLPPQRVLKFLQIFSKQAKLMDILIANFIHVWKNKKNDLFQQHSFDENDYGYGYSDQQRSDNLIEKDELIPNYRPENQLQRLALTTFNELGQCIGKMGSWNFI